MPKITLARTPDATGKREVRADGKLVGHFTTSGKSGFANYYALGSAPSNFHNVREMRNALKRTLFIQLGKS